MQFTHVTKLYLCFRLSVSFSKSLSYTICYKLCLCFSLSVPCSILSSSAHYRIYKYHSHMLPNSICVFVCRYVSFLTLSYTTTSSYPCSPCERLMQHATPSLCNPNNRYYTERTQKHPRHYNVVGLVRRATTRQQRYEQPNGIGNVRPNITWHSVGGI